MMNVYKCDYVFVMWQDGVDVDRVNGVNAAELVKKVQKHAGVPTAEANKPSADKVCFIVHLVKVVWAISSVSFPFVANAVFLQS